jgi:cytochrome c556
MQRWAVILSLARHPSQGQLPRLAVRACRVRKAGIALDARLRYLRRRRIDKNPGERFMRLSAKQLGFGAALIMSALAAGAALSQDKDKIVTERQEAMKQQGRQMVAVRNYFQDKGDQASAISAMEDLQKSVPKIPDWFPPGTGVGEVPVKTMAKPEIWREHDKFVAADKTVLGQLATLEAAVKSGDKPKIEVVFKEIGFCKACHDPFRAKEQ